MILWAVHASDWQLALLQREQQQPTTSAGVSPRTTTQAITRAQRTPASFALSASLPFALLATTLAPHSRQPIHVNPEKSSWCTARTTPGRSEIIESRPPRAQHLATTHAIASAHNPIQIIVNPVKKLRTFRHHAGHHTSHHTSHST